MWVNSAAPRCAAESSGRFFERLWLVLELIDRAFLLGDIVANPEVYRLVNAAGLMEGVKVTHLNDRADLWDPLIRWNGGVPGVPSYSPLHQHQAHTAPAVDPA